MLLLFLSQVNTYMVKEIYMLSFKSADCSAEVIASWCTNNVEKGKFRLILNHLYYGQGVIGSVEFQEEDDYEFFLLCFTGSIKMVDWDDLTHNEKKLFRDQQTMWGPFKL